MAEWAVWYESGERGGEAIMTAFTQSVCLLLPLAAACLRAAFSCTLYNSVDRSNKRSDLNQLIPVEHCTADCLVRNDGWLQFMKCQAISSLPVMTAPSPLHRVRMGGRACTAPTNSAPPTPNYKENRRTGRKGAARLQGQSNGQKGF